MQVSRRPSSAREGTLAEPAGSMTSAAPAAGRQRMRGADRRQQIEEVAARLFAERGVDGTSMQDIAAATGIRKASLYYFYASKEDLIVGLLRKALQLPQQRFEAIIAAEGSTLQTLEQLIAALVNSYDELLPLMTFFTRTDLASSLAEEPRREIKRLQRRFEATWEGVIKTGIAAGELRADLDHKLVAFGIIGMINWMYKWYRPDGRKPAGEIARTFSAMICDGLRAAGTTPGRHRQAGVKARSARPMGVGR